MSLTVPHALVLSYTRYMMASLLIDASPQRVLLVGVGAGSLIRFIHHHLPTCLIDGVDSSPHILKLARKYFHLPEGPTVSVHCLDGFEYLADRPAELPYDLIMLDAFDETGMAPSVYCPQFYQLCREHLSAQGVFSVNLWSGNLERMTAAQDEIGRFFSSVVSLPVPNRGNVICLAGNNGEIGPMIDASILEQDLLSRRFGINFKSITKAYRKNYLGVVGRLSQIFS